jgi:hypothetical protein
LKYPSTLLAQTNEPTEIQKADLDLLAKINADFDTADAAISALQAKDTALTAAIAALQSQSIIYGTNYTQYPDGKLEQWTTITTTLAANNATGSLFRTNNTSWTYPVQFLTGTTPTVDGSASISSVGDAFFSFQSTTNTVLTYRLCNTVSSASSTFVINILAIGRWK